MVAIFRSWLEGYAIKKAHLIPAWTFAVSFQASYLVKIAREKMAWITIISLLGPVRLGVF